MPAKKVEATKIVPFAYLPHIDLLLNIGCLDIHGNHVTANNSTNDNVVFFFVSDLKIAYYNNY